MLRALRRQANRRAQHDLTTIIGPHATQLRAPRSRRHKRRENATPRPSQAYIMNPYSSTQDFTADESGLLIPKDAPRRKRQGVAAALVALCFASGVAFSTSAAAPTRGASSLVDQDKSTAA